MSAHTVGRETTERVIRGYVDTMLSRAIDRRSSVNPAALKKYLVLSTPRTGSTMLCKALENSGLGWAVEWFNDAYIRQYQLAVNASGTTLHVGDYVEQLLLGTCDPQLSVFGVNVHVAHYQLLKARGFDLFDLGFDRVYYLHRSNKTKQAYSIAKSTKTGFWSRESEIKAGFHDGVAVDVAPSEFCQALTTVVEACAVADTTLSSRIDRIFCFEELLRDGLANAVALVARDLGLSNVVINAAIPTEQQSNDHDRRNLREILDYLGMG